MGSDRLWWIYSQIRVDSVHRWSIRLADTPWWTDTAHETRATRSDRVHLSPWRIVRLTRWGSCGMCSAWAQRGDRICVWYACRVDDLSWHQQCPHRSPLLYCSGLYMGMRDSRRLRREDHTIYGIIRWVPGALIGSRIPPSLESAPDTLWGSSPSWQKGSPQKNPLRCVEDFFDFLESRRFQICYFLSSSERIPLL